MAKSKPDKRLKKRKKNITNSKNALSELPPLERAQALLDQATAYRQTGQPEQALLSVKKSLQCLSSASLEANLRLPAIEQLAEIYIELGEGDKAHDAFVEAAEIDPSGEVPDELGGGADKFLWLAQLSEEGGEESVEWFERGITVLRHQIGELEDGSNAGDQAKTAEKKNKLANALCGVAEIYMTDLSWEDDAEARCEALVTEACLVAPHSPEPLQTLASVRVSQTRFDDARAALTRSMALWSEVESGDPRVPEFPTRISLARLLMEVELEEKALSVLETLVAEDDSSVEAWYLGGWCLHLLASNVSKDSKVDDDSDESQERKRLLNSSRDWLQNSLRLYSLLEYEDDRLRDHAEELVTELNKILGPSKDTPDQDNNDDEEEWEDEDELDSNADGGVETDTADMHKEEEMKDA